MDFLLVQFHFTTSQNKLISVVNKNGDINSHDFTKYGLPTLDTYCKVFGLNNINKKEIFRLCDIELNIKYIDTQFENGSENKILTPLPKLEGKGSQQYKYIVNWKESVGLTVDILYDNKIYKIKILDYKNKYLVVQYKDYNPRNMACSSFLNGNFKTLLNKRNVDYLFEEGDTITFSNNKQIILLEKCISKDKKRERSYKYKCLSCGNIDYIKERRILNYKGCNLCCKSIKKVKEEINSVWKLYPELLIYFNDIEEAKHITIASNKKVHIKCPNCGEVRFIKLNTIYKRLLNGYYPCKKCSDKKSYNEKFMFSLLRYFNIDFKDEKIFDWSKNIITNNKLNGNKRYDFYFKHNNEEYIIETHGEQHYKDTAIGRNKGRTFEEERENDKIKYELAINNGIKPENYIVIDCSSGECVTIKDNILNSKLSEIFNFKDVDFNIFYKYSVSNEIKLVCDLWNKGFDTTKKIEKETGILHSRVCKYLKQGNKLNWLDEPYNGELAQKKGTNQWKYDNLFNIGTMLVCLDDKSVFLSINDCERKSKKLYGQTMWHERLGKACRNKTLYRNHNFRFINDLTLEERKQYDIDNKLQLLKQEYGQEKGLVTNG